MGLKSRNIYRRKDGRYEGRYIKERELSGKAVYGAVYDRTYAGVIYKLEQARLKFQLEPTDYELQTVASAVEWYIEGKRHQIKSSTYDVYRRYLENHIIPYFGDMKCEQLSLDIIQTFIDNRLIKNGLSATTVQSVFCLLRKSLKDNLTGGMFDVNLPKEVQGKVKVLSIDEQKRLEDAASSSDYIDHISIILSLYTGIRIGELCGLTWEDVNLVQGLLHVRRTIQRIRNHDGDSKTIVATLPPKSQSSQRNIPLPGFLVALLKKYRDKKRTAIESYIISIEGGVIEPRVVQLRFKKLLTTAKIHSTNFHTLRHSFATRALENGFDIKTLSEIMGHSSPLITLKKYAHTLDEHKRKSMESLFSIYSKQ